MGPIADLLAKNRVGFACLDQKLWTFSYALFLSCSGAWCVLSGDRADVSQVEAKVEKEDDQVISEWYYVIITDMKTHSSYYNIHLHII